MHLVIKFDLILFRLKVSSETVNYLSLYDKMKREMIG